MVHFSEITSSRAIRRTRDYLVLDLETTGPDSQQDRVIRLGMVRVTGGEIVNKAETLVDPGIPIPLRVTQSSGVSDAMAARGRRYDQMAASLAELLPGAVLVAEPEALAFLRAMLEEGGVSGEFHYIDVRRFARSVTPGLPDDSPEGLAEAFGVSSEEPQGVLRACVLRHEVLQTCCALSAEAAGGQTAKRYAKRKKRRKSAPAQQREDLSRAEVAWFVSSAVALVAGIINLPAASGFLFLLAAVLLCPIPALRRPLSRLKLSGWRLAVLAGALVLAAVLLRPGTLAGRTNLPGGARSSFIILSWDRTGDYGTLVEPEQGEAYIRFYLPTGIYRVLNNNAAAATVSVYSGADDADGVPAALPAESLSSVTVLGSKSREITVDKDQYVVLSEKSENVILQYISEIPEAPPEQQVVGQFGDGQERKIAYVTGDDVRLRRTPSVGGFIMTTYNKGQEVVVTAVMGDWSAVTVGDMQGYIYSSYLSDVNPLTGLAAPTPSPSPEPEAGADGAESAETESEAGGTETEVPAA